MDFLFGENIKECIIIQGGQYSSGAFFLLKLGALSYIKIQFSNCM